VNSGDGNNLRFLSHALSQLLHLGFPVPLSVIGKPACQLFAGDAGILDYLVLVFLFVTINYNIATKRDEWSIGEEKAERGRG